MTMIYTGTTLSFHANGKFHQAHKSHPNFSQLVELAKKGDFTTAATLVDIRAEVQAAIAGSAVELIGNNVCYLGEPIHSTLARRILELSSQGFNIKPLLLFLENLMQNPSKRAVDELYGFLEVSKLPITDDGHFLAYKSVRQDFKDHHTGTMDNSVGAIVQMPRNAVDEDKDRTCSSGLHFAAHEYAQGFGPSGRMVVLKINPRDVVAIPSDYNNQKGRACRYEVIEEVKRDDTKLVNKGIVPSVPKKPLYVPESGNHKNPVRWENSLSVLTFIGTAAQFPVDRDVGYILQRKSNGKLYSGLFYFTSYDTSNNNLVFVRYGADGKVDRYVTISNTDDWFIEIDLEAA